MSAAIECSPEHGAVASADHGGRSCSITSPRKRTGGPRSLSAGGEPPKQMPPHREEEEATECPQQPGSQAGGGLWSKLLWSLSSGAVVDPLLRLRMWDFGNLLYTLGELAAVMIAVLAPCLYVRCRPVLIGAISAAPVVGGWLTLLLAPDAALRLCAVVYMCALRHRLGGICLGWRSAALLRFPTWAQLVTGPLARVLRPEYGKYLGDCVRAGRRDTCGSMRGDASGQVAGDATDAGATSERGATASGDDGDDARSSAACTSTYWDSTPSPGGPGGSSCTSGGGYRLLLRSGSVEAYRCDGVAAVGLLPASWSPAAPALTSAAAAAASAAGATAGRTDDACSSVRAEVAVTEAAHASISRAPVTRSPIRDGAVPMRFMAVVGLKPPVLGGLAAGRPSPVLYRPAAAAGASTSGGGLGRTSHTALVSIKVPVGHRGSDPGSGSNAADAGRSHSEAPYFEEASARVLQRTGAALEAYNRAAVELWPPAEPAARSSSSASNRSSGSSDGPGAGGGAAWSRPPAAVPLRCLSAVCVDGCVQLLMVVHFMAAGVAGEEAGGQEGEGQAVQAEPYPPVVHVDLQLPVPPLGQALTAPAAGIATVSEQAAAQATEPGGGVQTAVEAAARAAVQHWLAHAGAEAPAAGAAADALPLMASAMGASAFCWPPALPLLPRLAPADGAGAGQAGEGDEAVAVVVLQLPATASARGLRTVRCVLAGPAAVPAPGGDEGAGKAAVVHLDAEVPLYILQQPSHGRAGSAPDQAYIRMPVPSCARQTVPGLRMLHLLPPRAGHIAAEPATPGTSASSTAPSSQSDSDGGRDSTAPLAVVPLLVVGSEAAAELQQLHGQVLGDEAVARLHQLTTAAVVGAAVEAEAVSSHSAGEGLSGAAAALQHSGLTSLVLDFGALLQVTQSFAASGADADGADSKEPAAAAFGDLLRFLAAQRMAGCLREALAALQRAGVQLLLPGEDVQEAEGSAVTAAAASGGGGMLREQQHLQEVVDFLTLTTAAPAAPATPSAAVAATVQQARSHAAPAAAVVGYLLQGEGLLPPAPAADQRLAETAQGRRDGAAPAAAPSAATAPSAFTPAAGGIMHDEDISRASYGSSGTSCADDLARLESAASSAALTAHRLSGSLPARMAWWLRVLAFGFPRALPAPTPSQQTGSSSQQPQQDAPSSQPLSLEAAYQAYKAASCRPLDRMSLNLYTGFRVVSFVRTCATAAAEVTAPAAGSGRLLWVSWQTLRAVLTVRRRGLPVMPPAAAPELCAAAGGGCPRPYLEGCCGGLTDQQLQLLSQCLFLGAGLLGIVLAVCTRLHQRRRNAFLLLRAGLDAAALLAMMMPLPRWPAPLLGFPETWLDSNSRAGVHWLVFGLYEPLTLQLSPYLQAIQALIFVLPLTLLGYHSSGCRWRPALRFGFGHALLALAVSAATDTRSRWLCDFLTFSISKQPSPSAVERGGAGTRAAARGGGAEKHKLIQYKEDEVAISQDPQQQQRQRRPLSFSRWFAREARATDVFVVLLLWSLSSGAVLDPVLRLQMWDYSNLIYTWTQLAVVLIALLAPALYERCRHALMAGAGVAMLLGVHWSLWAAPSGPFPLNSCVMLSAQRRRIGCVYMGWKSATVFRVPASAQLVTGLLLWLVMAAALPMTDRRMPPPGRDAGGGDVVEAAGSSRATDTAGTTAGASGLGARGSCGDDHDGSAAGSSSGDDDRSLAAAAWPSARGVTDGEPEAAASEMTGESVSAAVQQLLAHIETEPSAGRRRFRCCQLRPAMRQQVLRLPVPPRVRMGAAGTYTDAPAGANTSSVSTNATINASAAAAGTSSARSSMSGGPDSTAPLAVVPLLVVGSEAAAELQQLHAQVLGDEAVAQLHQLTTTAAVGAAVEAEAVSSHSAGEGLSGAAAALQHSGLTSLVLDFGALLQVPQSFAASGADADESAITESAAAAFVDLLRFLAAQRMAGCLREALAPLQRAGEQLPLSLGGDQDSAVAAATASGDGAVLHARRQTAAEDPLRPLAQAPDTATACDVPGHCTAAGPCGDKSYSSAPGSYPAEETSMLPFAAPSAWPPGGCTRSQLVWWLRVLAFGFPRALPAPTPSQQTGSSSQQPQQDAPSSQPLSLEAAYQAYKAASCRPLDRMSLNLYTGFRVVSFVRTCATAAAEVTAPAAGSGRLLWVSWLMLRVVLTVQRRGEAVMPPAAPELCAAAGGCPRPYLEGRCGGLTGSQLEVIGQCLFLGAGLLGMVLAACTRLHQRRRNAFLLLRAGLDAAAVLAMMMPLPRWPAPLLGLPQTWHDNNRRVGMQWMLFGLYEPLTLQLSPYLQAIHCLIYVLPMTLVGFYSCNCRWRPALRFGFGHALLALAVSAATDTRSRLWLPHLLHLQATMSGLTEAPHSSSLGAQAAEGSAAARTYSAPSAVERGGGGTRAAARGGGAEKHKLIQYKEDEVAISEDPQQRQRQCRPLSFSRWFAREARATDVFMWDYSNFLYIWTQLAVVLIALLAPALYERCRHALMAGAGVAMLLGVHWSLWAAPSGPFPLNSCVMLSAQRRRIGCVYMGWKSATVFRVPASAQLVTGPLLWLLMAAALPMTDRRMPPPGSDAGGGDAVEAAGSRRAADTAGTTAGASGLGAGGGCGDDLDGSAAGSSSGDDDRSPSTATSPGTYGGVFGSSSSNSGNVWACRLDPSSRAPSWEVRSGIPSSMRLPVVSLAAAAPPTARATPASGRHQAPPAAGVLYRSSMSEGGGGLSRTTRTALVSIKVPVRHRGSDPGSGRSGAGHSGLPAQQLPTFEEASALVLQRTGAALKSHNRRANTRLQEAAAIQPTAAGAESVAVGSRLPAAVPLRCLSAVCVEGCVQLLMVVHFVTAGVAGEEAGGGVADGEPEAAASVMTGKSVSAAVQQLLAHIGTEVEQIQAATSASAASASSGASVTAASTAAPAFCWPPALPLLPAAPGDAAAGAEPLAGGEAGGVETTTVSAYVRLPVPPRMRMGAGGLRMMYVLPPPAHETAAGTANAASAKESPFTTTTIRPTWLAAEHGAEGTIAFPAASSLVSVAPSAACGSGTDAYADAPAGANTSSVSTNATVNASAAASGTSSARSSMSGGRDSTAPLAVVPLLVVGSEAAAELRQLHTQVLGDEAVARLHQLTTMAVAGAAVEAEAVSSHSAGEGLSGAAAALQHSGLTSLVLDFGALLQVPQSFASGGADADESAISGAAFVDLLRFLAAQRMAGCLREALAPLQRACVQLPVSLGEDQDSAVAAATASGDGAVLHARWQTAAEDPLPPPAQAPDTAPACDAPGHCTAAGPCGDKSYSSAPCNYPAEETSMLPFADPSAWPPGGCTRSQLVWWLRVLAFGFPRALPAPTPSQQTGSSSQPPQQDAPSSRPLSLEAAYQAYKAASCRPLDRMSLNLYTGIRVVTTLRTYTSAGLLCVYLAVGVLGIALAACTRLHQRRRNAFLLLRAGLDAAAFMTIALPLPRWPAPLLGFPETWLDSNSRAGVHWLMFGLYEPLTLQLSPYLQAIQALIFVLPLTLLGYHSSGCRWRPALRFGFGHALLALAVSAATDARSRAAKGPRKRRGGTCCAAARGGEAEKRQPEQYEEDEIVSEDPQQHQRQRRPLSFSRWFAREARATDVFMVLAELLWSLSSGAVLDPVLRLQMWDYSNFLYIWTQLAVVLIALLAPALYERCRHALMAGAGVAMLLGVHWSLWAAPPGPFPLNSCIMLSAQRRRIGCVYMGWKSATVFRVPASTQLVTGPLLWLLMAAALPMTDRRMPPPGSVAGGGVLYRSHTKANGLLRRTRSALVSVKVPIQHRGSGSGARGLARSAVESSSMDLLSFEQASALVLRSAAGELNAHNATQAQRRLQAAAPAAVPLRCLSAVCVEGCVQLLMVVHFVTAGAEEEEAGGPQGEGQAAEEQLSVAATGTGQVPKAVAGTSAAVTAEGAAGDAERAMAAAAAAAVQQLLAQIGAEVEQMSTAAGASAASASNCASITVASTAAPAFCWPPALPLLTTAPGDAPAGAEVGGAPGEGDEAVVVLLQLPAASGGGLRSVRCVLAGPAAVPPAPEPGGEGAGEGGRAGAAAAVAHMDVELPLRPLQQPLAGGEAGGGVETTVSAYVRLPVPPRVRMGAGGLRMMYVLPPLGHDTAAGTANAASAKETGTYAESPAGANPSSVSTNATVNASADAAGTSSARSSMSGGPDSTAPLAVVPLLVVGSEAAAELHQLHGHVLGDEAVAQLHQLTTTAVAGAAVEAEGGSSHSAGEGLSGAAAALQHSGLTSLVLDFGALLQVPQSFAASGADADESAITESAAAAFVDLLRFLAAQRMAGCLREALAPLQRAGVQLPLSLGEDQDSAVAAATASGDGAVLHARRQTAAEDPLPSLAQAPDTAPACDVPGPCATAAKPAATAAAKPAAAAAAAESEAAVEAAAAAAATLPHLQLSGSTRSQLAWWPLSPEAAYQDHKAATCRALDSMALVGDTAFRVVSLMRTCNTDAVPTPVSAAAAASKTALAATSAMAAYAARIRTAMGGCGLAEGLWRATQLVVGAAGPQADPGLAAGSCPRPYLEGCCGGGVTSQDLHVLGQAAFLTAAVVCLALAACTRLHQRRRNAFLLLRAGLDAAVYLAMTLPLPLPRWPAPLLGLPQTWLDINRRTGLHWLVFGLCEPLMFQLSPYLQAIQALIFMLPLTLIGYHSSGCRWRPALRFGFGHALLALAVSAATDARSRGTGYGVAGASI
eukprot:XP_001690011.1 predicted protein [Chlamydomonas reinhardtii]